MQKYIGTKIILAMAMTLGQYNKYQGWEIPKDQDPEEEGFLVEYTDGGKPNHPDHEGYISWAPRASFESAYLPTSGMSFGLAIESMKKGFKVARSGWNGKGMWLIFVKGSRVLPTEKSAYHNAGITTATNICGHIDMFTAKGEMAVGWLASQADMLATDWEIIPS